MGSSGVAHLMRATNASGGGVFLAADPEGYPQLADGTEVELHLVEIESPANAGDGTRDEASDEGIDVHARGRIVRVNRSGEQTGFGIEFTQLDDENRRRLDQLLARLGE